jgi:hypothetical protein
VEEAANALYITNIVNRYKDVIQHWEIQNEPNLSGGWSGTDSSDTAAYNDAVHKYTLHLQNTYNAIKAADNNATVILGGLSEWNAEKFIERLNAEQAYKYFDETALHPYANNSTGIPVKTSAVINKFSACKAKLDMFPVPYNNKPIWVTEIGYHWELNQVGKVEDEYMKAERLIETMYALHNINPGRPVIWYCLHEPTTSGSGYGLTQKSKSGNAVTATRLPALYAMRNVGEHTNNDIDGASGMLIPHSGRIKIRFTYKPLSVGNGDTVKLNNALEIINNGSFTVNGAAILPVTLSDYYEITITANTEVSIYSVEIYNKRTFESGTCKGSMLNSVTEFNNLQFTGNAEISNLVFGR